MSFFNWIRNKGWNYPRREPLRLPPHASPRQIRRMIERLLDDDSAFEATAALHTVAHHARPQLEEAYADPRFRDCDHWPPHLARPVFQVVLELLQETGSDAHLREAERMADSSNAHHRQIAAHFLCPTGDSGYLPVFLRFLADADSIVQDHAFDGLIEAAEARRIDAGCIGPLYDLLRPQALRANRGPHYHAAPLMLLLDRDRAIADLTCEEALRIRCNWLCHNIRALKKHGVVVPTDRLRQLLDDALRMIDTLEGSDQSQASSNAADLLELLAGQNGPGTAARVESLMAHPMSSVSDQACKLRLALEQLDPVEAAFAALNERGWERITAEQRIVIAVNQLDWEVRNGGFLQYFSNSFGERVYGARDGLRHIGASTCAAIVDEAIAFFGPRGVPADRDQRNERLAAALQQDRSPFNGLDDRWYADGDRLQLRLARFAIQFADQFRPPKGLAAMGDA